MRQDTKLRDPDRGPRRGVKPTDKLNFVGQYNDQQGVDWQIRKLPRPSHAIAVNVKNNNRWLTSCKFPTGDSHLPLINRLGKFTGCALYKCNLQPSAYLSTVISTVYRRLFFHTIRYNNIHVVHSRQNLLLKVAAYYVLTKNSYSMDRFIFLTKKLRENTKLISSILHSLCSKLDAHKWFVYGHVCLQTKWLTSRALRPRDKSALIKSYSFMLPTQCGAEYIRKLEYDSVWYTFYEVSQI